MEKQALTVTQLTYQIKNHLENHHSFQGFVLKGEISNFVHHRTGHLYFALKDENSQIRAIMFSNHAKLLKFKPKDGDKVTVKGSISVYPPQGSYSIQVTSMQIDGAGELYLKYLELKEKLKNLGWFDKPKKTLPRFPKAIGVVTSPTGAVIEDITNTVNRRYRLTEIILYPALVQGSGSSQSVADQIKRANEEKKVDCLIVGRGGGSIEDLWGFNELPAISAIYNSKIPIITAIGHETDDTISDLVSDLRAPTPTAAAELATPDTLDLVKYLKDAKNNIEYKTLSLIRNHQNVLMHLQERLDNNGPSKIINDNKQKLKVNIQLLQTFFNQKINNNFKDLKSNVIKLNSLSPKNKLKENFTNIEKYQKDLNRNYKIILEHNTNKINTYIKSNNSNYINIIDKTKKDLNNKINLINNYATNTIAFKIQSYNNIVRVIEKLNPLAIMQRGYTIVKHNENIISSINDINIDDKIEIGFHDGKAKAKIISKGE